VSKVEASDLSMEQKAQIGDRPVIQLEVLVDGRLINWRSNKTSIKISVDYTPKEMNLRKPIESLYGTLETAVSCPQFQWLYTRRMPGKSY